MMYQTQFALTLSNDPRIYKSELFELEALIQRAKPGDAFKISLFGPGTMFTDTALAAYEIIRSKREGVLIHTHAHSWLEDADVLVWLAGDYRSLRPGAWIEFQDVAQHRATRQRIYKRLKDSDFVEDQHAFERSTGQMDYAQAERLVLRHMPKHLFNRPVWGGELAEWNIITSNGTTELQAQ